MEHAWKGGVTMGESLKRRVHDDIVRRWFHVRTPGNEAFGRPDYSTDHIQSLDIGYREWRNSRYEHSEGDELRSYGAHFPLVQAIRNRPRNGRMGAVRLWLLNGDRWGGSGGFGYSTSSQQLDCQRLARESGIPSIILPFSAIDAAGIDHGTIQPLAIDEDSWHSVEFRTNEFPEDAKWIPQFETIPGTGYKYGQGSNGWVEYPTMESIPGDIRAYFDSEGRVLPQYRERVEYGSAFGRRYRKWNEQKPARDYATGDIVFRAWGTSYFEVPPVYRFTGERKLYGAHGEYSMNPDGSYTQTRSEHTLGQSVFRAAYRGSNGKRYFANFLSGVDDTPTGSGYFLVQLPRGANVESVASAIESLKPQTMGIECKRQGDLFAIPTEFNMRKLRTMGADIRRSALAGEGRRAKIRERWEDRFTTALMEMGMPTASWEYRQYPDNVQWRNYKRMHAHYSAMVQRELREWDSTHAIHTRRELYGTRHFGTDIAILPNGVTLARGTIRHSNGDHSMLRLGKVWHIVVRNTVPLAK
jgi:hypothetical protein